MKTPQKRSYVSKICQLCGKEFTVRADVVKTSGARFCSHRCGGIATNPNGGKPTHDSFGYVLIRDENNKQVREHRVIAEKMIGRKLLPGEVVHHINGIKNDNRPENLAILNELEHHSLHNKQQIQGRWAKRYDHCASCGTTKIKHNAKGFCMVCYKTFHRSIKQSLPL